MRSGKLRFLKMIENQTTFLEKYDPVLDSESFCEQLQSVVSVVLLVASLPIEVMHKFHLTRTGRICKNISTSP